METKFNYAAVGTFVIVLTAALIVILIWLASGLQKKHRVYYLAFMTESVSGLNVDSPVKYNGVEVGAVREINLNLKNTRQVRLLLAIDQDIPITEATTATLTSQGITGVSYIDLKSTIPHAPLLEVRPGEEYPVIRTEPSLLTRLDITVRELSLSLQKLSNSVASTFNPENQRAIKESLANLSKITSTFAANTKQLDETLKSAAITFRNTAKTSRQLPSAVQTFSDQLLPQAAKTLHQLQSLTGELQQNPSMLIRGRQPIPPGPGE